MQGAPGPLAEGPSVPGVGPAGGYTFSAQSFQHSLASSQTTPGPTSAASRTVMSDITLTKSPGPASQYLMQMLIQNHVLPSVTVDFTVPGPRGQAVESQIVLQNVFVKGVQRSVNRENRAATDTVTLGFSNISWTHYGIDIKGVPVAPTTLRYDAARGTVN